MANVQKKLSATERVKGGANKLKDRYKHIQFNKILAYKIGMFFWGVFRILLIIGMAYVVLYPLIFMLSKSLSGDYNKSYTSVWIPSKLTFNNINAAIKFLNYPSKLASTFLLSAGSAVLQIFSCSMAGYAFARFKFRGKNILFALVIFSIIIPPQTYILGTFSLFRFYDFFGLGSIISIFTGKESINLVNTNWAYWIPSFFGMGIRSGLFIYIFREFFAGLPRDLEEAARIDGCGAFKTFLRIMLPNAMSASLTVFLFSLVWHWNEYYTTAIILSSDKASTLSVRLYNYMQFLRSGSGSPDQKEQFILNAASLLAVSPLILVFIFAQRYFIESVGIVGIKG